MLDVAGLALDAEDRRRLSHPLVGGVILFARNYADPQQLAALTAEIRALRTPHLLIATDHEGGRVQRFRDGFTRLPAARELGRLWDAQPAHALRLAQDFGYVLAAELRAHGVDLSFAPVLDLDYGRSAIIGSRAMHGDPDVVADLAHAMMVGMRVAGMAAVAKHFPGHGWVEADSHTDLPLDDRPLEQLQQADLRPFARLIADGLPGIMPAHVRYPAVDERSAGFSPVWLQQVLRGQLGFDGAIFSDDLSMAGAAAGGDIVQRARTALHAGCDMLLVCNDGAAADRVLHALEWQPSALGIARRARLHGRAHPADEVTLREQPQYVAAQHAVAALGHDSGDFWRTDPANSCGLSGDS